MTASVPNVLTIAGSDPSGGAGLQGDLKTFAAFRVNGCAVPTALTAQNSLGVHDVLGVPAAFVARQLDVLFDDVDIHAVKIGMLGDASIVAAVCDVLRRRKPPYIVLDPVLRATAGGSLLDGAGLSAMREHLLPLATLVTPNADEAGALLGLAPPTTVAGAELAARALCDLGVKATLVTGGHLLNEAECADVLFVDGNVRVFRTARSVGGTHGTGCALSSAIASLLALGNPLAESCEVAQAFVAGAVRSGASLDVGSGTAPVHSLHRLWV